MSQAAELLLYLNEWETSRVLMFRTSSLFLLFGMDLQMPILHIWHESIVVFVLCQSSQSNSNWSTSCLKEKSSSYLQVYVIQRLNSLSCFQCRGMPWPTVKSVTSLPSNSLGLRGHNSKISLTIFKVTEILVTF